MTKQQRQLSLQSSRVSERLRDRQQKEDLRQESFIQLQQQMKNACAGRNMDLQHGASDMVSSFRGSSAVPPSPVAVNNFGLPTIHKFILPPINHVL